MEHQCAGTLYRGWLEVPAHWFSAGLEYQIGLLKFLVLRTKLIGEHEPFQLNKN